jgi:hypothetical protein
MTWEDLKRQKEDSIRESTRNPMSLHRELKIDGKTYKSYSEYLESEEYEDMLKIEEKAKIEYAQKAEEYFQSLDNDQKLLLFYHITNLIFKNHFKDGGSYRALLYDKFEFGPESYGLGMDSGMFAVHNAISTPEENEEKLQLILKNFNLDLDSTELYSLRYIIHYGCIPSLNMKNMIHGQLSFDFEE